MSVNDHNPTEEGVPHCGVCQHVYFQGDWDRSPYCSQWDDPTQIRVGSVCSAFVSRPGVNTEGFTEESDPVDPTPPKRDLEVADDERETGIEGPFFAAYDDDQERYGWFCSNCRTLEVAMDSMGRLECSRCSNVTTPTEWDSAY